MKRDISKRMLAVARMVTIGNSTADIGCDHGFVSIYLVEHKISPFVIAMDINQGPLEQALLHIRLHHLEHYIQVRRSDGCKELKLLKKMSLNETFSELETDTILIAGMGGQLICRILEDSMEKVLLAKEIILQPQSQIHLVRRFLSDHCFRITDETMVFEEGKYYPVIKAVWNETPVLYDLIEEQFGPVLIEQKNPVLLQYLEFKRKQFDELYQSLAMQDCGKEKNTKGTTQLYQKRSILCETLERYNQ